MHLTVHTLLVMCGMQQYAIYVTNGVIDAVKYDFSVMTKTAWEQGYSFSHYDYHNENVLTCKSVVLCLDHISTIRRTRLNTCNSC